MSFLGSLAQLGERLPYKQNVGGSIPSTPIFYYLDYAGVAQLAEQLICNQQVAGSSPITGFYGGIAQLGEHLPCKQGVNGSIPFISTIFAEVAQW